MTFFAFYEVHDLEAFSFLIYKTYGYRLVIPTLFTRNSCYPEVKRDNISSIKTTNGYTRISQY